jgi:hypothetical protein
MVCVPLHVCATRGTILHTRRALGMHLIFGSHPLVECGHIWASSFPYPE